MFSLTIGYINSAIAIIQRIPSSVNGPRKKKLKNKSVHYFNIFFAFNSHKKK